MDRLGERNLEEKKTKKVRNWRNGAGKHDLVIKKNGQRKDTDFEISTKKK